MAQEHMEEIIRRMVEDAQLRMKVLYNPQGALIEYGLSEDEAANSLYESVGFTEAYREYIWRKVF